MVLGIHLMQPSTIFLIAETLIPFVVRILEPWNDFSTAKRIERKRFSFSYFNFFFWGKFESTIYRRPSAIATSISYFSGWRGRDAAAARISPTGLTE